MNSPYTLPDGNVAIAFSGGRTSAYMLYHVIQANRLDAVNSDRVCVTFQNTGAEADETLDFVQECSDRWGLRIVWVEYRPQKPLYEVVNHNSASRDHEPFDALLARKKMLPNIAMRFCTQELKIKPARRHCLSLGWQHWTVARGIRADEMRRAATSKDKRITNWHPMVQAGVTKSMVAEFWRNQNFGLRLPHLENGNPFGNCVVCPLKSEHAKSLAYRERPKSFAWAEAKEAQIGATWRDGLPLRAIRENVERQGDWIFDTEGALCQANDGECTG